MECVSVSVCISWRLTEWRKREGRMKIRSSSPIPLLFGSPASATTAASCTYPRWQPQDGHAVSNRLGSRGGINPFVLSRQIRVELESGPIGARGEVKWWGVVKSLWERRGRKWISSGWKCLICLYRRAQTTNKREEEDMVSHCTEVPLVSYGPLVVVLHRCRRALPEILRESFGIVRGRSSRPSLSSLGEPLKKLATGNLERPAGGHREQSGTFSTDLQEHREHLKRTTKEDQWNSFWTFLGKHMMIFSFTPKEMTWRPGDVTDDHHPWDV